MPPLRVLQLGNPILRKKSKPLSKKEICSETTQRLLNNMVKILDRIQSIYKWPILGIAAPQVGILKRVIVIDYEGNLYKIINPKIIFRSLRIFVRREACLSFFYLRGYVARNYQIVVEALDENGNKKRIEAKDYFSRILQHEIDHLDGILYLDRLNQEGWRKLISIDECYKNNLTKIEKLYKIIDFLRRAE
jgi:peptide deformylase